jgi:ArsR family metal-binding transcriptional regulator
MTVASSVKQCKFTLQGIEQGLLGLSTLAQEEEARKILNEARDILNEIVVDLGKRVEQLEMEEPQYKGL